MDPGFFYETVVKAPSRSTSLCLFALISIAAAGSFTFNWTRFAPCHQHSHL